MLVASTNATVSDAINTCHELVCAAEQNLLAAVRADGWSAATMANPDDNSDPAAMIVALCGS